MLKRETEPTEEQAEMKRKDSDTQIMLKYFSLSALVIQNTSLILVMRYVRTRPGELFLATTAVILAEICKLLSALIIIFYQEGCDVTKWFHHLYANICLQPMDCVKVSVPSFIYVLQNNLLFLAVSNLDAATFQVTYQLKILTTALFSVFMLNKQLSRLQWMALVILFGGVSLVQLQNANKSSATTEHSQNQIVGLVAVLVSCVMSGFAGVYFEKILKGTKQSVWLRNVQLASVGIVIGIITMMLKDGDRVQEKGFFHGYDILVLVVIGIQAFGGLLVAVVVKYADNILKGFATSASIILSCIFSMIFFDFVLSPQFAMGAMLVIASVYIYGKYVPKPDTEKDEKSNGNFRPVMKL